MRWRHAAATLITLSTLPLLAQPHEPAPTLAEVLQRMGEYVAAYGERTSLLVAVEKYTQTVSTGYAGMPFRPRSLVAEIALVKTADEGDWIGFRDVVEVDGARVSDRDDRLRRVLTGPSGTLSEARRIADESSRYNVGPVIRNFNVPTTALFFLSAPNQPRFAFKRRGDDTIDGVRTWRIDFRETRRPTLVRTRAGKDVPSEGSAWVVPGDGTIVRTRLALRGFADAVSMSDGPGLPPTPRPTVPEPGASPPQQASPPQSGGTSPGQGTPAPPSPGAPGTGGTGGGSTGGTGGTGTSGGTSGTRSGGSAATGGPDTSPPRRFGGDFIASPPAVTVLESSATIEVTYRRDGSFDMWLPARMSEAYAGVIPLTARQPILGEARTLATYSQYKRFETSAKIVLP